MVVRSESIPSQDHLRHYIHHLWKHLADVHGPESRDERPMCDTPFLLLVVCSEEAVLDKDSDGILDTRDGLLEPFLVTDLVDELPVRDDDNLPLDKIEGIDGSVDICEFPDGADCKVGIKFSEVADEPSLGGLRDWFSLGDLD